VLTAEQRSGTGLICSEEWQDLKPLPNPNSSATLLDMTDKPYCFSQDYELAVTVSSISGPKDLMRMAYGTKEPRHVIEQAMKETALEGGIWEDAITFYPVSAIIGYRLVEMDGLSKERLMTIRERIREEGQRLEETRVERQEQKQETKSIASEPQKSSLLLRLIGKR
jgi:hypothetical protein